MNYFFTSDHHFGHKNIIKYANRPFQSVEEMNAELIRRWNTKITNDDIVYHLGDMIWKENQNEETELIYRELNYKELYRIPGNHDPVKNNGTWDLRDLKKIPYFGENKKVILCQRLVDININNKSFTLCHYPLLSWNRSHYGSFQLFGHHHGDLNDKDILAQTQIDVSVETNNYYPYSLEDIIKKINDNRNQKVYRNIILD